MHWALLAIPKLWAEFDLVKSVVNFRSRGDIAMVVFIAGNLGEIARTLVFIASLHGAHDLITGLYRNWSSLMCTLIFKLMNYCSGCIAVALGHQAVPCLLQYISGW